jgi:serine/threonine protein kinase
MKGEWVAKVNHINSTVTACLAENNAFIDGVLRGVMNSPQYHNHIKTQHLNGVLPAKLSVSSYKRIVTFNEQSSYVITFERKMKGDTLAALLRNKTINDLEQVKTILNQIKLTLQFLWSTGVRFLHHDMHCGNIFIEEGTNIPIIFDFDMSARWLQDNTDAALHFDKLYTNLFEPTFLTPYIEDLVKLYVQKVIEYKDRGLVQCDPVVKDKLQLNQGNSWNWINAAYSLHANNYFAKQQKFNSLASEKDITTVKYEEEIKTIQDIFKQHYARDLYITSNTSKCDMAMIVNSIMINCCHYKLTLLTDKKNFLSLVNDKDLDSKLSLTTDSFF